MKNNFYLLKSLLSRNHWPCFQTETKRLHTEENFPTNTVAVSFLSGENLAAITSCKSQTLSWSIRLLTLCKSNKTTQSQNVWLWNCSFSTKVSACASVKLAPHGRLVKANQRRFLPIPGIIRAARNNKQATWLDVVITAMGIPSAMG